MAQITVRALARENHSIGERTHAWGQKDGLKTESVIYNLSDFNFSFCGVRISQILYENISVTDT